MKKILSLITISLFLVTHFAFGAKQELINRYSKQYELSTGQSIVVAEGDFEPRSIGSYSIKIYEANPEYPTDNYLYGVIRSRDGSIENVVIQDINNDAVEEVVIIIRSPGTGGYLSADAFHYQSRHLKLIAEVSNLEKSADPIHELIRILKDYATRGVTK